MKKQDQNIKLDKGAREEKMFPQPNESTYNCFNKVRESKMPGTSSVRSLLSSSLKATASQIDQIVRVGSISRLIVHHH